MGVARSRRRIIAVATAMLAVLVSAGIALAAQTCPDQRSEPQLPTDLKLCERLAQDVRHPGAFRLDIYEAKLNAFLKAKCHRDERAGWVRDKHVRDVGPWIGTFKNGAWEGKYFGTHAPVLIWYSPEMHQWLKENRPVEGARPDSEKPVPDGAIMVKEMYKAPAAACARIDPTYLLPTRDGAAIMVRDSKASYDGWFWGWYSWDDAAWKPDWPAVASSPFPNMGFGQYCTNCHASAKHNSSFASLNNIKGEKGEPLVFLSQNFFLDPSWESLHSRMQAASETDKESAGNDPDYNPVFLKTFGIPGGAPERDDVDTLAPSTYDSVWPDPGKTTVANQYVTSDQCIGCHSAGGTGLQYDMTEPGANEKLINISPYGTWRGSPMGLAGRDPIFFAQVASETDTFHPDAKAVVEDTCLGCHGVLGQRQHAIDTRARTGKCEPFPISAIDTIPWSSRTDKVDPEAKYAGLARDGISCTACHHMILTKADRDKYAGEPQNVCVEERQKVLNPGLTGFAATFTGSFLVGAPGDLYGPFKEPLKKPMQQALGLEPAHRQSITSSEMCGSCHTVHLPILDRGKTTGHVYEQTTYPEWAFSDFRTGDSPDGILPYGSGQQAQSCQGCHMPNKDQFANAYRSKIAAIQEYSNFPQSEHSLPPADIDLPTRAGFAKHTLVGLNVFLLKMAWQFPDLLGIRKTDPMLAGKGADPIPTAEAAMLEQANNRTATVTVADVVQDDKALVARVTVVSKVGHKFPSGVGFRRAFVQFSVLDVDNKVLWASGRTDDAGVIIDDKGVPVAGEMWWDKACSHRLDPLGRAHQPHFKEIGRQDQAQIYQELVAEAAPGQAASCGSHAEPKGPLTTSFLAICAKVKDNRILPQGFLDLEKRIAIAKKLGADDLMAEEAGPTAVGDDKDYERGGADSLLYRVPLADIPGKAAAVQATLYYQATPPYYLQDRFCTSTSEATRRLYYLAGKLGLSDTPAQGWKLRITTSGPVTVP